MTAYTYAAAGKPGGAEDRCCYWLDRMVEVDGPAVPDGVNRGTMRVFEDEVYKTITTKQESVYYVMVLGYLGRVIPGRSAPAAEVPRTRRRSATPAEE